MKKNIAKITAVCALLLCATVLISASRPSVEGRAFVASEGELPPGLFIKAATFLPGDTVIITNPVAKVSLEVLVFDIVDEGYAAVLSPEVARKLYVTNEVNNIVQITKIFIDEKTSGLAQAFSGAMKTGQSTPDTPAEDFVDDSVLYDDVASVIEEVPAENIPVEEPVDYIASEPVFIEEPITESIIAKTEPVEAGSIHTPFSDMDRIFPTGTGTAPTEEIIEEIAITEETEEPAMIAEIEPEEVEEIP
ncbi:MAG: hypothetical protein R3Y36_06470, partial [Spirochaetales bacterium]